MNHQYYINEDYLSLYHYDHGQITNWAYCSFGDLKWMKILAPLRLSAMTEDKIQNQVYILMQSLHSRQDKHSCLNTHQTTNTAVKSTQYGLFEFWKL